MGLIRNNVTNSPTARIEIFTSTIALAWFVALANPFTDILRNATVLKTFTDITPNETLWSIPFGFTGLFGLYSVLRGTVKARIFANELQCLLWSGLTMTFAYSDFWGSPWAIIYLLYVFLSASTSVNLRQINKLARSVN